MMHMTFYWGKQVTLLFDNWKTNTWLGYSLSLLAVFLFCIFHEYLANLRLRFKASLIRAKPVVSDGLTDPLIRRKGFSFGSKVLQALLFGLNTALAYMLMLAIMSYNGGVFLAAVLGFVVGYLFFRSDEENLEISQVSCGCA
eukprot:TRINITY_DN5484_c0_g1_i1.p1 TRINITY_DN5484_c0_g1~~TRINITY_DN5484_c0_g1_i1.p1  ORF type:complete len:142 (+),score=18.09 TRINITY_DN5484_c0_g1_i1:457-882(+)